MQLLKKTDMLPKMNGKNVYPRRVTLQRVYRLTSTLNHVQFFNIVTSRDKQFGIPATHTFSRLHIGLQILLKIVW